MVRSQHRGVKDCAPVVLESSESLYSKDYIPTLRLAILGLFSSDNVFPNHSVR